MPALSIVAAGASREGDADALDEARELRAVDGDEQPGVGAELPGAERQRRGELARERLAAIAERTGQQENRVDAAHLGVHGDRYGPAGGDVEQRPPAGTGAGEADGADARVGDEARAERVAGTREESEHAARERALAHRALHGTSDELGGAGMGRMALDDDRAAGGEGRGGVAAGDGEGEREVARPEHGDRAERHAGLPEIGPRPGPAPG